MTKSLTEQWKDGKLEENWYYIHLKSQYFGNIDCITINYCDEDGCFEEYPDEDIVEVITPVPDFNHFSQLVKKVEKLEQQLAIATKALKESAESDNWFGEDNDGKHWSFNKQYPWRVGFKALKEIEEVK